MQYVISAADAVHYAALSSIIIFAFISRMHVIFVGYRFFLNLPYEILFIFKWIDRVGSFNTGTVWMGAEPINTSHEWTVLARESNSQYIHYLYVKRQTHGT